jgi:hypothetical protein
MLLLLLLLLTTNHAATCPTPDGINQRFCTHLCFVLDCASADGQHTPQCYVHSVHRGVAAASAAILG